MTPGPPEDRPEPSRPVEVSDLRAVTWSPDGSVLYGLSGSRGAMAWNGTEWQAFNLP